MIKTNKDPLLLMMLCCLTLHSCNKSNSETESDHIKQTIDSLQNLESACSEKTASFAFELKKHQKQHPQYDNMYLLSDNLTSLQDSLSSHRLLLERDIKKLAEPFYYKHSFIKNILKRNDFCKLVIDKKENKSSTEECIAILKANEANIKDEQNYKKQVETYYYIKQADSLVYALIDDIDSYQYFFGENPNIKTEIVSFENRQTTQNNMVQYMVIQHTSDVLKDIRKKHLSVGIDNSIAKTQRFMKTIWNDNAIEDSLIFYQQKQQELQAQIQQQQQLLNQKTK
ncbi:MAG: hypothetical protein MJ156_01495 [Alphaproteobacteria bacterium]|nr:hypothetical protein [Alphaproteobacteria bacterium]